MALRVVLDTDVMVAGFASATGASRRLLLAVLDGEVRMLLSTPLLVEYEAVLTRPAMLAMAGVSAGEVMAVLDELAGLCVPVAFDYRWRPQARDPDDDLVLETAINGGAEVVTSFNVSDMQAGARRFGIAVERPGMVMKRIKA
jgi:putative PIN family toxin of toxin-antitoxin system